MTSIVEVPASPGHSVATFKAIDIAPSSIVEPGAKEALRRVARRLSDVRDNATASTNVATIRAEEVALAEEADFDGAALAVCIHVLCDLRAHNWAIRVDGQRITAVPPASDCGAVLDEKARLRAAHLVERDAQLGQPSVRRFIREMERHRLHNGEWHCVFSLVRDGRQLAAQLQQAATIADGPDRLRLLRSVIDPYVQVVTPDAICEFTGLRLLDVWRYFRHTWTTTYQSTPGRKIFYLIRDRAAANHPIVGIAALGSAIVQLAVRDEWIGWTGSRLIAELRENPTGAAARWLHRSLDELLGGIFKADFLKERVLSREDLDHPTATLIKRLTALSRSEREIHRLYPSRAKHKRASGTGSTDWKEQARTHLFRSKRAATLAALLGARLRLQQSGFGQPTASQLRRALSHPAGARAVETVLRFVKAAHVGVDMMDITVCGAVAPYNALLGGKLVSLLMASPDVVAAYNKRYHSTSSLIASSMAGRPVRRTPHLVFMGTTSLYGVGASQYNRLRLPAELVGGVPKAEIAFNMLGRTVGYGSYHFSQDTMKAMDVVLRRSQRGRQVNSIFGEGVNPKLRKVRGALDAVGLPSDLLLQHGSVRLVYGIPLATNFRDVLLGRTRRPEYILLDRANATERVIDYWRERWLSRRIEQPSVLAGVMAQSLAHPVRHGARVALPDRLEELGPLFG